MRVLAVPPSVTIGDEVWVAVALLHREHPDRRDFTIGEIVERLRREGITPDVRPGVTPHVYEHTVANRPPSPQRLRLLFATGSDTRRLYRAGDPCDVRREGRPGQIGTRTAPQRDSLPERYRELLDWYGAEYAPIADGAEADPILSLLGMGKGLWADEHPDDYVRRIRAGW